MTHNLATRPQADRQAVEIDKARAFIAHQWLTQLSGPEIRQRLADMDPGEEQDDLRRRLNEMRTHPRYAKAKNNPRLPPTKARARQNRKHLANPTTP